MITHTIVSEVVLSGCLAVCLSVLLSCCLAVWLSGCRIGVGYSI